MKYAILLSLLIVITGIDAFAKKTVLDVTKEQNEACTKSLKTTSELIEITTEADSSKSFNKQVMLDKIKPELSNFKKFYKKFSKRHKYLTKKYIKDARFYSANESAIDELETQYEKTYDYWGECQNIIDYLKGDEVDYGYFTSGTYSLKKLSWSLDEYQKWLERIKTSLENW